MSKNLQDRQKAWQMLNDTAPELSHLFAGTELDAIADALIAHESQLRAELEAVRADAERYRWLRRFNSGGLQRWAERNWPKPSLIACPDNRPGCLVAHYGPHQPEQVDAAIDAARGVGDG